MSDKELKQIRMDAIDWLSNDRTTFDESSIAELAESIRGYGLLAPIGVIQRGERFSGLWGQRRFMAVGKLGHETIAALVQRTPRSEADALAIRLSENVQREQLSSIDLAHAYERLLRVSGQTAAQLAKTINVSPAAVSKAISLLKLPPELQSKVGRELSPSAAYELSKVDDPARQTQLAAGMVGGLTRDAVSGAVRASKRSVASSNSTGEGAKGRVTAKLGGGKSVTVIAPALSLESLITVLDEVKARARASLAKGHSLATFATVLADEARRAG